MEIGRVRPAAARKKIVRRTPHYVIDPFTREPCRSILAEQAAALAQDLVIQRIIAIGRRNLVVAHIRVTNGRQRADHHHLRAGWPSRPRRQARRHAREGLIVETKELWDELQQAMTGLPIRVVFELSQLPTEWPPFLDRLDRIRPDVVLMDINLAGDTDGITAATAIRHELHIPCVFLTAYATNDVVERAKQADPSGYIIKPFTAVTLKEKIDKIFQRVAAAA